MHGDPQNVDAPVARVTVMEDRAQVRRRGRVELAAGQHLLRVAKVTPLAVDRTLRAGVSSNGAARLLDVRIRRETTVRASAPELERVFESVARSCMTPGAAAGAGVDDAVAAGQAQ